MLFRREILVLGLLMAACPAQAEEVWDQFLADLPDRLPEFAQKIENCVLDTELSQFCGITQEAFGGGSEESTPNEETEAVQFLVASMTNALGVLEQGGDWVCTKADDAGQLITPVLDAGNIQYAIRASGDSCYLDILDGNDAS